MKQAVFIIKKNPLKLVGKVISQRIYDGLSENPKIYWEKQKTISSARTLSRLFSSWPFDEDSFLSTSCEICYKFPFVVQCKT